MMSSRFSDITAAAAIEVFALKAAYVNDVFPEKVDLGIGAYRDNNGKPWVLPVVRQVEQELAANHSLNHEYLGQMGDESFSKAATAMLLGADNIAIKENRAFGIQSLSGTGCLRIAADFLHSQAKFNNYLVSEPTWDNHNLIFKYAGFATGQPYRYWDPSTRGLDIDGMLQDLKDAPEGSVVILHTCAHNPTGVDPTQEQWNAIADVIQAKNHFPLFDCAYQGFASGNLEKDSWVVPYFVSRGFELVCTQSFAKNFGLYDARVGNLTVVVKDPSVVAKIKSQMALIVRGSYSNPPSHGARIVAKVLNDPDLFQQWQGHITEMSGRIITMRSSLREKLEALKTPGSWNHITSQIGMFSYTGLTPTQVEHLVKVHHVYLLKSGRISMCGLNTNNVDYVVKAIHETVTTISN